jgi:hypothetical protein
VQAIGNDQSVIAIERRAREMRTLQMENRDALQSRVAGVGALGIGIPLRFDPGLRADDHQMDSTRLQHRSPTTSLEAD